jgi:hypothetical protein
MHPEIWHFHRHYQDQRHSTQVAYAGTIVQVVVRDFCVTLRVVYVSLKAGLVARFGRQIYAEHPTRMRYVPVR